MPFLLINKPLNWTSHDVVGFVRGKIKRADPANKKIRVGHAGTLDPFATGLLIVGVGRESTKQLDNFKNLPKTYIATIKLGEASDTFDITGNIINGITDNQPTGEQIAKTLKFFTGEQLQMPPMFSAKKINGQKLYDLARKGIEVERQPSKITVYGIRLLEYSWPYLKIEVKCSTGTYIRSLADDIGRKLGTGALCAELTRTKIGDYDLDNAQNIDNLNFDNTL